MRLNEEQFLMKLLSISSVNGVDSEKKIAIYIKNFLAECGVNARLQEIDDRHANVIARLEGETDETVIWNGHLDTVPYGDLEEWRTKPSVPLKKDECIYARGASDMKGGLAGMVWALGKMKEEGRVPKQTIVFYGTCDEEKNGMGARYLLENGMAENASLLLIGEPTGLALGVAQKGCIWMELNIHGKTSHGAYPQEGINAVEYGISICHELKKRVEQDTHKILGNSTIQITMLNGGIVPNMTPDEAKIMLDIRTVPGVEVQDVIQWAEAIAEEMTDETKGQLKVEISLNNNRRPIEIADKEAWLKKMKRYLEELGWTGKMVGINYFTDASILTLNTPLIPVLLFGPGEPEMAHKPNEYIKLEKYFKYIDILMKIF